MINYKIYINDIPKLKKKQFISKLPKVIITKMLSQLTIAVFATKHNCVLLIFILYIILQFIYSIHKTLRPFVI